MWKIKKNIDLSRGPSARGLVSPRRLCVEQDEAPVLSTPIPFHFLPAFLGNKGASGSRGPSSRPHFSPVMWNGVLGSARLLSALGEGRGWTATPAGLMHRVLSGAFPTACPTYRFIPFGLTGAPVGPGPDRRGYFKKSFQSVRPEWGRRRVLSLFS